MSIVAPFTGTLKRVVISGWINKLSDIFSQLLGNKMAHADGRKCSSEWSTKTTKRSGGTCFKGHVAAVMDYALWLFSNGVYKPDGLRH